MDRIKNFRFWCHKVLPLVYDDSLSYYEFLCKVMKKLNDVIESVNEIIESETPADIAEMKGDIRELQTAVNTINTETVPEVAELKTAVNGLIGTVDNITDELVIINNTLAQVGVKVAGVTPTITGSTIYFNVGAGYKPMRANLVFKNGNTYKVVNLTRITENIELQTINFVSDDGITATLACNTETGGCALDDDFSLTAYTGVYGTILCNKITT